MTYKPFDIVTVPFPFSDTNQFKKRPAIILSSTKQFGNKSGHSVLAMITSARNAPWPLDVLIHDLDKAGLPKSSVIRMKFFTLDNNIIIDLIGSLAPNDMILMIDSFKKLFTDFV